MSGTLKVGGVPLATHTGTDGLVTGMSWGSSVPAGTVLQVVYGSSGTNVTLSQTLGTMSTGVSLAITPSSISSKILVFVSLACDLGTGNHSAISGRVLRNTTEIFRVDYIGYVGGGTYHRFLTPTAFVLDSPATTSAVTYYGQAANGAGSSTSGTYTGKLNSEDNNSSFTLIELQG